MKLKNNTTTLSSLIIAIAGSAQAIDFTDFKTPDSDYQEAYVNASVNMQDGGGQAQSSYDVDLNGNYLLRSNTARQTQQFALDASASVGRDSVANAEEVSSGSIAMSSNFDNYIGERDDGAFWFGGLAARHQNTTDNTKLSQYDASVGVGYGRIYDATPYARAFALSAKLEQYGISNGALSDAKMLDIASIVAREDEYRSKYSQLDQGSAQSYRAKMLADVEAAIAGDLQGGSLGAAGTIYANEALFEQTVNPRSHGFVLRAGAAYTGTDLSGLRSDEPALKIDLEYAKPLGETGQFSNTMSLLPAEDVTRASNVMRYTQALTERSDWRNAWMVNYQDQADVETISHSFNSDYVVRAGDNLYYSAGLQLSESNRDDAATTAKEDELATSLTMGINYRVR